MELRESKARAGLTALVLGVVLTLVLTACGGGGGSDDDSADGDGGTPSAGEGSSEEDGGGDDSEGEPRTLAQVTGESSITLTVTRAAREEGGFLTVEGTLHNGGGSAWGAAAWAGQEQELASNDFSMAGASLTAKSEGKKYLILRDTSGRCLCTRFDLNIAAGETVDWFAQFPAPAPETSEVDLQIGKLPPATFEIR
ncbi:hypothetical protein [Streptomyces bohaiensis]|uniref:Secreted protein n=1 Tax=Streptomyces bohaiensis TaxID=1431344 RepID=A0ABX1CBI6_9ACTN|nr:hypothetical protein [Streptomyces bohaiensis]NJQ15641.1 hypothetical protein [Streptomyces bohaiensis]